MKTLSQGKISNKLLLVNLLMALIYFSWWFYFPHIGNKYLYFLLFFGEIYHIIMALGFWFTIWNRKKRSYRYHSIFPSIDVFITIATEPLSLLENTLKSVKNMDYPNYKVYVLNDGFLAGRKDWQQIEELAKRMGVICITRPKGGGAKAGNINNGLKYSSSELVAILDTDMEPHKNFLSKLVPYFSDNKIAFVQSPQYYRNYSENIITEAAWDQQNFFFGPIMIGKNNLNSAFLCGTNVLIRRKALKEVGGLNEKSIAEDFLTSFYLHKKGWKSIYFPEVLCEGLAPEDLLAYYKQQHRWARGSLEIVFRYNPFFRRGFTFSQRFQYFLSALYYFNGLIVLIDIIMPLLFLYFGVQPVTASTQSFALFFIPYMFFNLYTLYLVSDGKITFRAISFSQASWYLQLSALFQLLFRLNTKFSVTPKKKQKGNFVFLIYPHLIYTILALVGIVINFTRYGTSPEVTTNTAWALLNIIMFLPFMLSAFNFKRNYQKYKSVNIAKL